MPLARYQIRDEYGLADPELYRAADKDDPEALLEGVAMAGLVGVLRQLGDLAEFAAEVFHDLHEEVMATAARGHGLMARVQQLEAEVPSIEKALLSQTDQSLFFTNAGVEWHPNLRMEQNLATRGDLPRFVMDSYEECRGPPRLFLLDKFDVAGAGACLKRYTDPSLFKVETVSSGIEVQREKKIRKAKKKGSRWRNGETPEVVPTSHAKLHQLFLEERIENAHFDPARLVKLKRRQLNGSPFDLKPGKSYMEKFLGSPSPEHKEVCEVSVNQSPLRLTLDDSSESGIEIHEISTVSPARKSSQGREGAVSSPMAQEVVLKSFSHELDEEVITREIVKVPNPISDGDDASPYIVHKMAIDELAVDGDRKTEESLDDDHSDDLMSEVDNYMDALTTMESELETDYEFKPKDDQHFLKVIKHGTDSDANDEPMDVPANFSDSQSFGNSSISDDGKNSFKKGRSSFSYSDSLSNVAENTVSDSEGAMKMFPSENRAAEFVDSPLDQPSFNAEDLGTQSNELMVYKNMSDKEDTVPNAGEASCISCLSDSNSLLPPSVPSADSIVVSLAETVSDEPHPESLNSIQNGTTLPDSSIVVSDPSQTTHDNLLAASSKSCHMEEVDNEDQSVFVYTSDILDLEKEGYDGSENKMLQTDNSDGIYDKNLVEGKIDSPHSVFPPSEEQFPSLVPTEVDMATGVTAVSDSLDVNPVEIVSEVNDVSTAAGVNSEILTGTEESLEDDSVKEKQCSDIAADVSQVEHDSTEVDGKAEVVSGNAIAFENQAKDSDKIGLDDHVNLHEDVDASPVAVATGANDGVSDAKDVSSNLSCFPSSNLVEIQESLSGEQDPHQTELDFNEIVLPECCTNFEKQKEVKTKSEKQKEVEKLEIAPTYLNSSSYESVTDGHSDLGEPEHVHVTALSDQTQNRNTSYVADARTLPSSELNNQESESHLKHSVDSIEDAVSSPTCYLPEVETALEHSLEFQADHNLAESCFAVTDETNSESSYLQHSPNYFLAEPGIPLGQSPELQSDKLDVGFLPEDKASSKSSNLQSEQIETLSDIGQERCLDASSEQEDLPSQGLPMQSACQEVNDTVLSENSLESVFPSFGPVPENLDEMPPLPPLPPMQWRLGKFQPAPLASHGEWIDHGQNTFLPTQLFTTDENSKADSASLNREILHSSNPFLSSTSDIQKSKHLSAESVSFQPTSLLYKMPTVATDANNQQDSLSLEGTQSLNPFQNLPKISNEGHEDGFLASRANPVGSSSDRLPSVTTVEHTRTEHDPEASHDLQSKYLNQEMPESISEAKAPKNSLQNVEEVRNSLDNSVLPPTMLEDQYQNDLATSHRETWSQNTLALPPTYDVGKPNGSKLPRPRNPLIDAVAAHDKSKLRKVTERVRPEVGPKVDERDSLLEQIRTKSFNLKPTTVTRPSIKGIQGPKTNLKVAAILEKANAIRQALAGSDEDDDSDGWSDS